VSERDQPWEQRERHPGVRRAKGHEADCDGVSRLAFQRRRASIAALADRYSAEIPEPAFDLRTSRVEGRASAPTTTSSERHRASARRQDLAPHPGETRLGPDTPARENFQHRRVPAANAL